MRIAGLDVTRLTVADLGRFVLEDVVRVFFFKLAMIVAKDTMRVRGTAEDLVLFFVTFLAGFFLEESGRILRTPEEMAITCFELCG